MEHTSETTTPFSPLLANTPRAHTHKGNVFFDFLWWYFVIAPGDIITITINFLVANLNYFSIALHLRTLFAYWHRDFEVYNGGANVSQYFSMVVMNSMSRVVGFLIRSVTIFLGLIVEISIGIIGAVWLLLWWGAPLVGIFIFYHEPSLSISFSFAHSLPSLSHVITLFHHGVL